MADKFNPSTCLHPFCCPTLLGTSITNRHNSIQQAIELFSEQAGANISFSSLAHADVTKMRPRSYDDRLKSTIVDSIINIGTDSCALDYTVSLCTAPSHLDESSANLPLHIAEKSSKWKCGHHNPVHSNVPSQLQKPICPTLVPFALDAYGGIHRTANNFIDKICVYAENHTCIYTKDQIAFRLKATIAMAMCRENANIVISVIQRAASPGANYSTASQPTQPTQPVSHRKSHKRPRSQLLPCHDITCASTISPSENKSH